MSDLNSARLRELTETVTAIASEIARAAEQNNPPLSAEILSEAAQSLERSGLLLCAVPGLVGVGAALIATGEAMFEVMEQRPWPAPGPATV